MFLPLWLGIVNATAQAEFKSGYYINNDKVRVSALIKDMDWDHNPDHFQVKLYESTPVHEAAIDTIIEFGIEGSYRYIRAELPVDQSTEDINKVGTTKDPIWKTERVFLKILVEGAATLYHLHAKDGRTRFFFSVKGGPIQQLIYKQYSPEPLKLITNDTYRQQLYLTVNCYMEDYQKLSRVGYNALDLVRFFKGYNNCVGDIKSTVSNPSRDVFRFSLKAGLNFARLAIANTNTYVMPPSEFPLRLIPTIGFEGELILPINKNKWSVPFEVLFQKYENEKEVPKKGLISIKYREIQVALGLRYHIFLKDKSRVFFYGLIDYSSPDPGYSKLYLVHRELDLTWPTLGGAFGAGFSKGIFSAELRYNLPKSLITGYLSWSAQYRVVSLVAGFRLFKTRN